MLIIDRTRRQEPRMLNELGVRSAGTEQGGRRHVGLMHNIALWVGGDAESGVADDYGVALR